MADDPILQALARLQQAKADAERRGETVTREHALEALQAWAGPAALTPETMERVNDMFRPPVRPGDVAARAVNVGLLGIPELAGNAIGSRYGKPMLGTDLVGDRSRRLRDERPDVAGMTDVASAVATLPLGGPVAKGALSVPGIMARGAATGAVTGAMTGAADAPPGQKLQAAAVPAMFGAAAGGILSGATQLGRFSPTVRAETRLREAIDRSGGVDQAIANLPALTRGGRERVPMLADLSPATRSEADFVANASDRGGEELGARLRDRQLTAPERLRDDFIATAGSPNAPRRLRELADSRKAWAERAYGEMRETPLDPERVTRELLPAIRERLRNSPTTRNAWRTARDPGNIAPDLQLASDPLFRDLFEAEGRTTRPTTFQDLHAFKRRLDAMVSRAFQRGEGDLGNALKTVRNEVDGAIEDFVPEYRAVQTEYRQRKFHERALQQGRDAYDQTGDEIAETVRALTLEAGTDQAAQRALAEFRYGIASRFLDELRGAGANRNKARELMNMAQTREERLRMAFPTKGMFDEFLARVASEEELSRLSNAVGGSHTARRMMSQAEGFDPLGPATAVLAGVPAGVAAGTAAANTFRTRMTRATAEAELPLLLTQGRGEIFEQLRRLYRPTSRLRAGSGPAVQLPSLAGRAAGSLLSAPRDDRR